MKKLERLVRDFRNAIDSAWEDDRFLRLAPFNRFPRECCGHASDLLCQYLLEHGIKTTLMEIGQSCIPYKIQREFWTKWREEFFDFLKNKESEYMSLERQCRKRVFEDAPRLTMEEASFSVRSKIIISYLHDNEEYVSLRKEYEALFSSSKKKTAKQLKIDEKRKQEIICRQYEIFDSIAKSLPLEVENLTPIEKYMCVCNGHFSLHYLRDENQWALLVDDKYYRTERILQSKHPYEDDDEVVSVLYLNDYVPSSKKKR